MEITAKTVSRTSLDLRIAQSNLLRSHDQQVPQPRQLPGTRSQIARSRPACSPGTFRDTSLIARWQAWLVHGGFCRSVVGKLCNETHRQFARRFKKLREGNSPSSALSARLALRHCQMHLEIPPAEGTRPIVLGCRRRSGVMLPSPRSAFRGAKTDRIVSGGAAINADCGPIWYSANRSLA